MKAYWNDSGRGLASDAARQVDLKEAARIWSDEVRGVEGNFLGLIDDEGKTIQFYFSADIPADVDDASHLPIVQLDFPSPEEQGSYVAQVTIGGVEGLIEKAFAAGADYRQFGDLDFEPWD